MNVITTENSLQCEPHPKQQQINSYDVNDEEYVVETIEMSQNKIPFFIRFSVRYPVTIFLFIASLCFLTCISLAQKVLQDGNPFTSNDASYDLNDIRSISYDSLRLARDNVLFSFLQHNSSIHDDEELLFGVENQQRLQQDLGDVTYWIYEAKTDKGVFTKDVLPLMRSTEFMLTRHKQYPRYCRLLYRPSFHGTEEMQSSCQKSTSAVNIFYASQWNSTNVRMIISELMDDNKVKLYNSLSSCIELNMLCQYLPSSVTEDDKLWARNLHANIRSIMTSWDGDGDLNQDIDEVSLFIASMNRLYTKSPYVNFYVDSNFSISNPITMYSRSIVYWGSPLDSANDTSPYSHRETSERMLKK